jgi:hypothetical protein
MHLNPLVNEDSETAATRGSTFYTAPPAEDTLSAEILSVAMLRDALSAPFQTIDTDTTSTSGVSDIVKDLIERQQEVMHLLEKWDTNAWMPPRSVERYHLLQLATLGSSERTSHQQESSVTELIANVRTSFHIPFGDRLAARLEELVEISEEEFPEQEPMSPRSLQDFLTFIRSELGITYPEVVVTYEGNVRAEWTKARNRHFSVEFLGGNDVRFVVFAPDPKTPYKTNRASGLSTLDSLLEHVHPYGVLDWITTPNKNAA